MTTRPRPGMGPNDGGARMALEKGSYLVEIGGFSFILCHGACKRNVDIVVEDDNEAHFGREIEDTIESWVLKAGDFAGNLRGHELLVNGEFADAREYARERLQDPADVIHGIHVRRVKAGDHGIKTRLLFWRQRLIAHRNRRVCKRVVVQRSVRVHVIGRRPVLVNAVGPLLLQRNAEQGHTTSFGPHHIQEIVNVGAFLNIVGQVEMGIVEFVIIGLRTCRNANKKKQGDRRDRQHSPSSLQEKAFHRKEHSE